MTGGHVTRLKSAPRSKVAGLVLGSLVGSLASLFCIDARAQSDPRPTRHGAGTLAPGQVVLQFGGAVTPWTREPAPEPLAPSIGPTRATVAHRPNQTVARVALDVGERVIAGTCDVDGAAGDGDTTVRLADSEGRVVTSGRRCGGPGSRLEYTALRADVYSIVAGCVSGDSCGGTLAYEVLDPIPPEPRVRIAAVARGFVGVDNDGFGLLADILLDVQPFAEIPFRLRLGGTPFGLAGGEFGGIAAGSMHLSLVSDIGGYGAGIGGGIAALGTRFGETDQREVAVMVLSLHGDLVARVLKVEGSVSVAFLEQVEAMNITASARLTLPGVDLILRGSGGNDGIALGELAAVIWVVSERAAPVFGISIHAGGAGVFHEPLCRFGAVCTQAHWYAGPSLGLGMEWRP